MSNKHDFLRSDNTKSQLFADTLSLMTKGAGYALGLCVILGVTYAVLIGVSAILCIWKAAPPRVIASSFFATSR